jgi:hypothetical protein
MTHTVTEIVRGVMGNIKYLIVDVTISSYTTGGEVLTLGELGFDVVADISGHFKALSANKLDFDPAGLKIIATVCSTGTQVASGVNIGTVRVLVLGDAAW